MCVLNGAARRPISIHPSSVAQMSSVTKLLYIRKPKGENDILHSLVQPDSFVCLSV